MKLTIVLVLTFVSIISSINLPGKKRGRTDHESFKDLYDKMTKKAPKLLGSFQDKKLVKQRRALYNKSKKLIKKINSDNSKSYNAEFNKFSMLTKDEKKLYSGLNYTMHFGEKPARSSRLKKRSNPSSYSWYDNKYLTPIKDQGNCGSCWSFAGITLLEARGSIETGVLLNYSEQEILDCNSLNEECDGGWYDTVWKYVEENGRLASGSDYSYTEAKGWCQSGYKSNILNIAITDYNTDGGWDEGDLVTDIQSGPVAIGIFSAGNFMAYSDGIFDECVDTNIDHAVVAVGYDEDMFLVRNSWDDDWGESGYIRMKRDVCTSFTYSYYSAVVTVTAIQQEE